MGVKWNAYRGESSNIRDHYQEEQPAVHRFCESESRGHLHLRCLQCCRRNHLFRGVDSQRYLVVRKECWSWNRSSLLISSPIPLRLKLPCVIECLMERVTATTAAILTTLFIFSSSSTLSLALPRQVITLSRGLTVYIEKKRGEKTRRTHYSRTTNRTIRYR